MNPLCRTLTATVLRVTILLLSCQAARAQYDFKWQTDGTVNTSFISNNTLYIGGSFSYVGAYKGCMFSVNSTTGEWNAGWPVVNQRINTIVPDGAGGWYIAGIFNTVGGVPRRSLAHLLPDKSLDMTWDAQVTGEVCSVIVSGGHLYIGGSFSAAGGQPRNNMAVLTTAGVATSWVANTNGMVRTLALSNGILYAGGDFTQVNGLSRSRLAAIDMSGNVTGWDPDVVHNVGAPFVQSLAVSGNTVYVAGTFHNVGGQPRNNLAALDATVNTNNALPWNPNPDATVYSMLLDGNTMYIGGYFTNVGGQVRRRIAQLDLTLDTGNAMAWDPNSNGLVMTLFKTGNLIYAGGQFTSIGGQTRRRVAALRTDINTSNVTAWDPMAGNGWEIFSVVPAGVEVLIGGSITSVNGSYRNNIAAIDLSTNTLLPWNPGANGAVHTIKAEGGIVYAGGDFTTIGGQSRSRIAAIDMATNTNNATAWNPGANATVRTLAIAGNTLYAGGDFTTIGGQPRNRIAALDITTNTNNATGWDPEASATVRALEVNGNTVYAGGDFLTIGAQPRNRIAALDATTDMNNALAWNPNANATVRTLALSGGIVYAGGDFVTIGGQSRLRLAALDATGNATAWIANANGTVRSIATIAQLLYVAGDFFAVNGLTRYNVASLDRNLNTANVLAWNPLPGSSSSLNTVTTAGPFVYTGGSFMSSGTTLSFFLSALPSMLTVLAERDVYFSATRQGNDCMLNWHFAGEEEGIRYELQRSKGDPGFITIAVREAHRTRLAEAYRFTDRGLAAGQYRYRLRMTAPGKMPWYSAVRTITITQESISVFPAMITGQSITVTATAGNLVFCMYAPDGRGIKKEILQQGVNTVRLPSLTNGIYMYTVVRKDGTVMSSGRLLAAMK